MKRLSASTASSVLLHTGQVPLASLHWMVADLHWEMVGWNRQTCTNRGYPRCPGPSRPTFPALLCDSVSPDTRSGFLSSN